MLFELYYFLEQIISGQPSASIFCFNRWDGSNNLLWCAGNSHWDIGKDNFNQNHILVLVDSRIENPLFDLFFRTGGSVAIIFYVIDSAEKTKGICSWII